MSGTAETSQQGPGEPVQLDHDTVIAKVREHLSEELRIPLDRITAETDIRKDLDADSLDLYELVMELEDTYGVKMSEEEAAEIRTVGDAVDFVVARLPSG
jgi:acyl carrier protein